MEQPTISSTEFLALSYPDRLERLKEIREFYMQQYINSIDYESKLYWDKKLQEVAKEIELLES